MRAEILERYEPVIGLEVHTHLATKSKLFSPAPVRYGDPPNHDVSPIDLGLPGVLPVLNGAVIALAIRFGLAIHATINLRSTFARKNYFYPDLPKGYQISQFEEPIVSGGWLEIEPTEPGRAGSQSRRIRITRAHLEEDAGKSIHDTLGGASEGSFVDLNRAGVPLLEIVSEPDLHSAEEAGAYLRALRAIVRYVGVSNADMEKGQFRCDANVSLRPRGQVELGTRTELKNMNSFANIEAAIDAEIVRQAELLDSAEKVVQATMAYDPSSGRTRVLRLKENADDYRYFPDPDLVPLRISEQQVEQLRATLPELPNEKRARFGSQYGLSEYVTDQLTASRPLADFFEKAVAESSADGSSADEGGAAAAAKNVSNWILRDLLRALNQLGLEVEDSKITPSMLASLVDLVNAGRLTVKNAQEIFQELVERGGDPEALMGERSLEAISDTGQLETAVDQVLEANPQVVESFRGGDSKSINFLMGQVMKKLQGKADPQQVRELLIRKLEPS